MNSNTTRALAVAVLAGGFTILGATAANATDIPGLGGGDGAEGLLGNGGLLGTGLTLGGTTTPPAPSQNLLDDLSLDLPVAVDGLNLQVLPTSEEGLSLGDGVLANTGSTNADILSGLGIDTSSLVGDTALQNAIVGVPLDVSNTWVSVLGNEPNGIVVVPNAVGGVDSDLDGLLDGVIDVPVDISCTSVTVLSDYENECAGSTPGAIDGGLLDGDILDLNGDVLGDGLALGENGVLVDLGDTATGVGTDLVLGDLLGVVAGAPVDLSDVWVSALGEDPNGIVIVPDLTIDPSVLTGGALSSQILAPISLDCVTITVLSDFVRDCGTSVIDDTPTEPDVPTEPTTETPVQTPVQGGDNGAVDNGGTDGTEGITDPCAVIPASATTSLAAESEPTNYVGFGLAALAGALLAVGLMFIGSRLGRQHQ